MPLPRSASLVEEEILDFFKEYDPSSAYINGFKEYAGKIFIPSRRNLEKFSKRADELRLRAENDSQLKVIDSITAAYNLGEPHLFAETILNAYFGYMIKEGILVAHMKQLTKNAVRIMQVAASENAGRDWPVGLRMLTLIRCEGVREIIKTVRNETADKQLRQLLDNLAEATRKYASIFRVKGFGKAGFDETYRVIKRQGADLGREQTYAQSIRRLWDYPETPEEVEAKGLRFLERELPRFKRLTEKLARKYSVPARVEEVSKTIRAKRALKPSQIIPFLQQLREKTVKVVNKTIVRVNPKYETKVIETPPYLAGIIPSGAAFFYDGFTNNPKEIFMATTDTTKDPSSVPGELLNLLIHEEYGHCVHASNSSHAYGAKPTVTDMLWSPLACISEGISFQREIEFQQVMDKLRTGKGLSRDEKSLIQFFEKNGGLEAWADEYEFYTWMWRIVRFLRIIGDARINSGKQSLAEFINWGNKKTGLSKSTAYFQLFPAHEGIGPGYASTYAIIGESIREIQKKAVRNGKSLLDFNTYACSLGFPARTIFEQRLEEYASK
ncbi:MAG TPA: hypothetical protein VFE98_01365 [Candidatus Bathyarchaeia archaeon]|nr:hypothetical protein [Candidatus Bathyarchaeia archaeon]